MSTDVLSNSIIIHSDPNTNTYTGVLRIQSEENLTIDTIIGNVILEARGRMSSYRNNLLPFIITKKQTIQKNQVYEFPFSFELDYVIDSYKGKNVSFQYKCEAEIHVNEDDLKKLDRSFFTKIGAFLTSDNSIKIASYFDKRNENKQYKITQQSEKLKLKPSLITIVLSVLFIGLTYLSIIKLAEVPYHFSHIFLVLFTIIGVNMILHKSKAKKIGGLFVDIIPNEHGFTSKINTRKPLGLTNPKLHYRVIEKVVDDRGTSTSTYNEQIFKSPVHRLSKTRSQSIDFEFPSIKNVHTLTHGDVSFYWELVLEGEASGISETLICKFEVQQH